MWRTENKAPLAHRLARCSWKNYQVFKQGLWQKNIEKKIKINPLGGKEDTLYSLFSDERTEVREELSDLLEIP